MRTAKRMIMPEHLSCAIVVYLAVLAVSPMFGQSLENFRAEQQFKNDSVVASLKHQKGLQYLSLAPTLNYDFDTGFNVGVNLSSLALYAQQRRRNRIELAKLEAQLSEDLDGKITYAQELEIQLQNLKDKGVLELEILSLKFELHNLDIAKYDNQQITLSDLKKSEIQYRTAYEQVLSSIKNLELMAERFFNDYGYRPVSIDELTRTAKNYELNSISRR